VNPSTQSAVRLRRGILARSFGGWQLQWIVALSLLVGLALCGILITLDRSLSVLLDPQASLGLIWLAIWAMGASAHADADDVSVRWRYFIKRNYPWSAIDYLRFGGIMRAAGGGGSGTPAILVSVNGREHPIAPALGCDTSRLIEFGNELIGLATARGVAVRVDPENTWWSGLRAP
jgi:hypothetical protein